MLHCTRTHAHMGRQASSDSSAYETYVTYARMPARFSFARRRRRRRRACTCGRRINARRASTPRAYVCVYINV